jgi:16S rRNA G966 N2-methylase RsmD
MSKQSADPRPDINYALVEGVRPAIYKAMKYWGKKPHNIWSTYIERYCPKNGTVLDPFVGSGIAAFEAAKLGRQCVAFDLNPLSAFFIEVLSSPLNGTAFRRHYERIAAKVAADPIYRKHFLCKYKREDAVVYNYRWLADRPSEVVLMTSSGVPARIPARPIDKAKAKALSSIAIPHWYPKDKFPKTPSITHKFIRDLGGDSFKDLWTRRNLYLLSLIFHEITNVADRNVRLQLLSGFVQTLHLTCRMVYPRSEDSNRDFSGSWGRADYMIRRKSMEQNPLIVFQRSCTGKQGVLAALKNAKEHFPKGVAIADITATKCIRKRALINYGIVDVADLDRYIPEKTIDFIITDPPYAGLVRYLDLSLVWLVWLQKVNKKYKPDLMAEITIKEGVIGREEYRRRLTNAFRQLHRALKDDGKVVITFHHQEIREWNEFVNAVRLSGFAFDKVTHQYNRRSGESNVANPYGTSGSDFYIRCVKQRDVNFTNNTSGLEQFIVRKAIEIVARRNEPTPYTFIFDGLVPELLQAGFSHPTESRENVAAILRANAGPGRIFTRADNRDSKAGDIWWFNEPEKHISHPDRPLKDRVEDTILALLRRKVSVRFDDVLAELFYEYPNGLTPDIRTVRGILEKYAFRSAGNWKIKPTAATLATKHTSILELLLKIGKRARSKTYVGRREQPESCAHGRSLRDAATCAALDSLTGYDGQQLERIGMIDVLWLNADMTGIRAAFEVENSTNFTSALQRASNLLNSIPKFMVIPDDREDELVGTTDPLFVTTFKTHNWKFVTYSAVEKLAGYAKASLNELQSITKDIP